MEGIAKGNEKEFKGSRTSVTDARTEAYVRILMKQRGMTRKEALAYIETNGLESVVKEFQAKKPDDIEKKNDTFKMIMGDKKKLTKQIEEAE